MDEHEANWQARGEDPGDGVFYCLSLLVRQAWGRPDTLQEEYFQPWLLLVRWVSLVISILVRTLLLQRSFEFRASRQEMRRLFGWDLVETLMDC